jgi:predicted ATP-dependent protease
VFRKAFGIRATFAPDMRRDRAALDVYASLVAALAVKAELPPVAADGVAALVELGSVLAGRRDRVTTGYGEVERALREAAYWARRRGAPAVERVDVVQADRARLRRDGAAAERLQELMLDGTLLAATSGAAIGQVNALSVLDRGYTSFGKPTRITASAAPGRAGIINIEREARLSGEIYDKGVLVITGFLRRRYAGLGPLPLTASVTFEQSYAGVDGDSASVAEVVALVSEVAQVPADQALAMTGSISQHGDVQPVRGINEKIRAFYGICRARGLDGTHGVVIPAANVVDLMLPGELVEHARAGRFTVHAVRTIDEALELALGRPLAQIDELVEARLTAFAAALREGPGDVAPTGAAVGPPAAPLAPGVG